MKAQDSGWYPEFLKSVVEVVADNNKHKIILDIGTGPGKLLEMLIEENSNLKLVGIDVSQSMLTEAERRLADRNVHLQL